ncbi:MAG: nucleoid occlusion protein [Erysipelotrichaceae bacterium]|nr:nucleoid occlusion protein [Erysipelotrichaceae bacterium]
MAQIESIDINLISPNPYQPRTDFDDEHITELARSIAKNGLIQPVVVRPYRQYYQLITGERRLRACRKLGWTSIPCIIRQANNADMATMALIENLQREDLSPVEEAKAYKHLLEITDMTQESLAQQLGKTQSSIANKIRLLSLSAPVQEAINGKLITERHGRAMLQLTPEQQEAVLEKVMVKGLNVRDTEKLIDQTYVNKKENTDRIRCFGVSTRIAINTIRQAIRNLRKVNMDISANEEETDDEYIITINIRK